MASAQTNNCRHVDFQSTESQTCETLAFQEEGKIYSSLVPDFLSVSSRCLVMAAGWLVGMLILDARLQKIALRKQLTLDANSETPPDLTDTDAAPVCAFIYNLLVCAQLCVKATKVCQDPKLRPAL